MLDKIYQAGQNFAENTLTGWAKKLIPDSQMNDTEKTGIAGALGIGAGNFLKVAGGFVAVVSTIGLVAVATSPALTVAGMLGLAATAVGGSGTAIFGYGMEEGGEKLSGLKAFSRELRSAVIQTVAQDFKAWRQAKLGNIFSRSAQPETPSVEVAVVPAAQPVQKNTL